MERHDYTPPQGATLAQAVRAHRGDVACLDAAGARLVTGGGDRALRLWRWRAGAGWEEAGEARDAHRYGVVAVRWAGGGALLASGGVDGAVRLWSGRGRGLGAVRALAAPGGAAAVRALCWAGGGGARLLSGHDDGALCVWAAARGSLLARVSAHEGALHALTSPGGGALALSACTHGVLKVYDLAAVCAGASASPLHSVDGAHDLGALCAAASEAVLAATGGHEEGLVATGGHDAGLVATGGHDAGLVATGGHDARIRLWRVTRAALEDAGTLEGHTAAVTSLRWASSLLASASLDRTARLWSPPTATCLLVVQAHARYLTAVALAIDHRYMITGSNDKTFRMWSLGSFTIDDELEPPCPALAHFALGDLEGIGPVEEGEEGAGAAEGEGEGSCGASRAWSEQAHAGAINCIATWDDLIATASSDGAVKVWRWEEAAAAAAAAGGALVALHSLEAHRYPALAADLGAGGALLLTAGLDGCAFLWDVQSGVLLRSLAVPGGGGAAGGGGVRGARLSPHRPPLLLLVTDDGLAPLWSLADPDPHPAHVYAGHAEAATCCAWSADGRVAATGAASAELRVLAPPRREALHHRPDAHDLGVQSCDFAPPSDSIRLPENSYLLATAGSDCFLKLWRIDLLEEGESASMELMRQVAAHGGAVASVRWAASHAGAALATAGDDRWARVWRVTVGHAGAAVEPAGAAPAAGAGGALAATLAARGGLLVLGTLAGELALWRLAEGAGAADGDDGAPAPLWDEGHVLRWLRDHVINAPGSGVSAAAGAALEARVRDAGLTGVRLLEDPVEDLMEIFGFEQGNPKDAATAARLRSEMRWLRAPPPPPHSERSAPHALLCPLTHRLLRSPARAADGFTYERRNLLEWLQAAPPEGAASPVSGRRLRSSRVAPNYALRDTLRAFLRDAGLDPALE